MARFSNLGMLVKTDMERGKALIELVVSQEPSLKAAATKLGVSTQTLRQMSEKCGISVKVEDIDLDAFIQNIADSYNESEGEEAPVEEAKEAPKATKKKAAK